MALTPGKQNAFQRLSVRLASTRWGGAVLRKALLPLDRLVLSLTQNHQSMTGLMSGLPLILLTTTGARSGQPRTTPLLAGVDGERLVIFATNYGRELAPAWLYNLRANPRVIVTYRQESRPYQARLAPAAEEESYWKLAYSIYPGYKAYRDQVRSRHIPVIVLEPIQTQEENQPPPPLSGSGSSRRS